MSNSTKSGGIGLCSAMFLLFLGLRLTDHIDWAWYWVAAPLWAPVGIILAVLAIVGLVFLIAYTIDTVLDGRRARKRAKAREQMRRNGVAR